MTRMIWDRERKDWVEPPERDYGAPSVAPMIMSDITAYKSPLGTGEISSRSKRREELKRHNCREVDPGEWKPSYTNERFCKKNGLPWTPPDSN